MDGEITKVRINPNGNYIAAGSKDKKIYLLGGGINIYCKTVGRMEMLRWGRDHIDVAIPERAVHDVLRSLSLLKS